MTKVKVLDAKAEININNIKKATSILIVYLNLYKKFAEKFTPITDDDLNLILHSCNSKIFYKNQIWEKTNTSNLFKVSIGSYNGA